MTVIETRLKKWGNSFGVVIPSEVVQKEHMKEDENIKFILIKDSKKALKETFGMLKGKLKKSGQQIKDELRKELYND